MADTPERNATEWVMQQLAEMRSGKFAAGMKVACRQKPWLLDYDEYRKSKLWQTIRERVLERDQNKCRRCGGRADTVHHLSYTEEVMKGDADHLLVSVCCGCHTFIEFDDAGKPRAEEDSNRLLDDHDPQAYPPPVPTRVGVRKKEVSPPPQWDRMSAVQKTAWRKAAFKVCKTVWLRR